MQRFLSAFTLILTLLIIPGCINGQQKATDEFVSPIGQFGVMLPPNSLDYYEYETFSIGSDKLVSWVYNWHLDTEQAVIIYGVAKIDLETKADFYLETLRAKYSPGTVINQKKTSFAGHPGLVSVVDTNNGRVNTRAMIWTYLFKNRVYLMSLTLDNKSKMEENLKLMSTFRILSARDVEPLLTALEQDLSPEPLDQSPAQSRPTTDAQDAALKGRVKTVFTESEPYIDGSLFGLREILSVENYDERGNISKTVNYRYSLPSRVRLYGTHKGERAFREIMKIHRWPDYRDKNDSREKWVKDKPRLFTIKYKHDPTGQLLQMRVLRDGGKEIESADYNLKAKTVTHRYDSDYSFIRRILPTGDVKMVSTINNNGDSIEDAYHVAGTTYEQTFRYTPVTGFSFFDNQITRYQNDKVRYEYKLDDRGNWIQRTTFELTKDKKSVATEVTYRKIFYYE